MKPINPALAVGLAGWVALGLAQGTTALAQGQITADHLYAGSVGTAYGDKLIWANGAQFNPSTGYYAMPYSTSGQYAGFYNSEPTMAVLAATSSFGGPVPHAPALGSFIQVIISLLSAPDGGKFGFWEPDSLKPVFNLNAGDVSSLIPISGGDENPDAGTFGVDPYGHIDGRRFSATVAGDYLVSLQLVDTSDNGLDGLPIHAPSDALTVDFRATSVPEPGTGALAGLGLLAFAWLGFRREGERPKPALQLISGGIQ
jgi:uncharacterized protein (TIGR03382 family)